MAILHTRVMIEHDIYDILHGVGTLIWRNYYSDRIAWVARDDYGSNIDLLRSHGSHEMTVDRQTA